MAKGVLETDESGYLATPDRNFAFARFEVSDPELMAQKFEPSSGPGRPLTANSPEAAGAIAALMTAGAADGEEAEISRGFDSEHMSEK